jgi:nuclear pore complex protein Nup85
MRNQLVLSYAEELGADAALWRIAVEYLFSSGEEGKNMADEILLRVPLPTAAKNSQTALSHMEDTEKRQPSLHISDQRIANVVQNIGEICKEHSREHVRRSVCKVRLLIASAPEYY